MASSKIHEFIHETQFADLPDHALHGAKRSLLDLIGVMAAGSKTQLANIIREHATDHFGTGGDIRHTIGDRKVKAAETVNTH